MLRRAVTSAHAPLRRCLISAGPTREFFDPVRFLSNPSTGKMGFALAEAAVARGWAVDLVAGPVALATPAGVTRHDIVTGADLQRVLGELFSRCDLLIMTAAVTDYRPATAAAHKLKRGPEPLTLHLEPVPDILRGLGEQRRPGQTLVGFAAETRDIVSYARRKLVEKHCDYIVANDVTEPGAGFATDTNRVLVVARTGEPLAIGPASKRAVAEALLALCERPAATAADSCPVP